MADRSLFPLVWLFSMLTVWTHWNFFSTGVIALGFNFSLFWVGVAVIVYSQDRSYRIRRDWVWLCPLLCMVLSYSVYENPWLKLVTFFVLPVAVGVFSAYSHIPSRGGLLWSSDMLRAIGTRFFKPLSSIAKVFELMPDRSRLALGAAGDGTLGRVFSGVILLIPLALFAILLLSSADATFDEFILRRVQAVLDGVSWLSVWKLALSFILTIALLATAIGWSGAIVYNAPNDARTIDGLVAGIVLGGLLLIYVVFLLLQLDNLVIRHLPESYRQAEFMVKSGFWQLFVLAVLNTGLFFIVYKKTGPLAQWVLRVFIIASSLLMVSAAWKVGLYSYTFGLSYEKYFACYTAVFALGVLLYLVITSFLSNRHNVIKTIAFAALWSFGVATISPVEKVIFHANLYFAGQDNTRVTVDQLSQLSLDIRSEVDKVYLDRLAINSQSMIAWRQWWQYQDNVACKRPWYEYNLSAVLACRSSFTKHTGYEQH